MRSPKQKPNTRAPALTAFTVDPARDGQALVEFLAAALGCSRRAAKRLLDDRIVFVNGRRIWMAQHPVRRGDRIETLRAEPRTVQRIRLLYEDPDFLVAEKPAGLLSNGANSVELLLRQQCGAAAIAAAHRLDRDTTGCLLFTRTARAAEAARRLFQRGDVQKVYHALVAGRWNGRFRHLRKPVAGQSAHTEVDRYTAGAAASHLWLRLHTGRTHQVRLHLEQVGYPLLGDRAYGAGRKVDPALRAVPRQMLHAAELELPHPFKNGALKAWCALPDDFRTWMKRLGLD